MWSFKVPVEFDRSLEGYAFYVLNTSQVSLSLSLQNQRPPKFCEPFRPPVRPFVWTKLLLLILTASSQKCSRAEMAADLSGTSPGFLLLQDFGLSSPLCFHKSLMPINRNSFYFIWFFYFSWLELFGQTQTVSSVLVFSREAESIYSMQYIYIYIYIYFMCVCVCILNHFSRVQLFLTQWTVACQAPMSMGIL